MFDSKILIISEKHTKMSKYFDNYEKINFFFNFLQIWQNYSPKIRDLNYVSFKNIGIALNKFSIPRLPKFSQIIEILVPISNTLLFYYDITWLIESLQLCKYRHTIEFEVIVALVHTYLKVPKTFPHYNN